MEDMLEPYDEPLVLRRNATELSRFCEKLLVTFIVGGAVSAKVRVELSPYDTQTLYDGLRRVCAKEAFVKLVEVHKDGSSVLLARRPAKPRR